MDSFPKIEGRGIGFSILSFIQMTYFPHTKAGVIHPHHLCIKIRTSPPHAEKAPGFTGPVVKHSILISERRARPMTGRLATGTLYLFFFFLCRKCNYLDRVYYDITFSLFITQVNIVLLSFFKIKRPKRQPKLTIGLWFSLIHLDF